MWKVGDILISKTTWFHDEISLVLKVDEKKERLTVIYRRPPSKRSSDVDEKTEVRSFSFHVLSSEYKYAL